MRKLLKLSSFILVIALSACSGGNTNIEIKEIHTEKQANFLAGDYNRFTEYATGVEELSKPNPVNISWDFEGDSYTFSLTKNNETVISYNSLSSTNLDLFNLEIGTKYTYSIENKEGKIEKNTFKINEQAPRNLDIDGITNSRDIGGWKINSKKRVKQGLLFRTSKLNEDESKEPMITEKGTKTMLEELKVKTELDLRLTNDNENGGLDASLLGSSVKYISIPMKSSGNVMTLNKGVLKNLFATLGNKDNYPMFFHCSIGTDRTGYVAFLINALLGVSEEDLCKDYLFSNFGLIYSMRTASAVEGYIKDIKDMNSGKNLAEKTKNYLISNGVAESDISNIVNLLTESI